MRRFLVYFYAVVIYRVFLQFFPLQTGEIRENTKAEFAAQVNILFYLAFFNSLIRTHFIPVLLMPGLYRALGARIGRGSHCAGVILDPPLTTIGDHSMIGHGVVVYSHVIEGGQFALFKTRIGHDVTVGAHAVIMSDVHIADGAIIAAGAVVIKGTKVGPNEIWGGVPAKLIGMRNADVA